MGALDGVYGFALVEEVHQVLTHPARVCELKVPRLVFAEFLELVPVCVISDARRVSLRLGEERYRGGFVAFLH